MTTFKMLTNLDNDQDFDMTETTEIANPPALEFANLIITVDGKTVDFPDRIQKDLPHDEIRRMAAEAVAGGIPGLEAQEVDFSGYIVDPVEAAEGMPDRILLRPKTAFGIDKQDLMFLSNGNPGALTALMGISEDAIRKLQELEISGKAIYVIWSDLCRRDHVAASKLIITCDPEKLKDAASRQDYSGRDLLATELDAIFA